MKSVTVFSFIVFFYLLSGKLQAQVLHEIGISAGPAAFTTDYGERGDFRNFYLNTGVGIGLQHYMNFVFTGNNSNLFKDFVRIRSELDYFYSKLDHYGPISYKNNPRGELLRAMHGTVQNIEAGVQLEIHFTQIRKFLFFDKRFSPYVLGGAHIVYFMPDAYSDLGPLDSPNVLFPSFEGGLNLDSGFTYSLVFGGGLRYRLTRDSDLLIEAKWNYYYNDYIEGLNVQGPQNQSNDWNIWVNFGYTYYLNF